MSIINFSDAKKPLKRVLNQVVSDRDYTIMTLRGADDVVVTSLA